MCTVHVAGHVTGLLRRLSGLPVHQARLLMVLSTELPGPVGPEACLTCARGPLALRCAAVSFLLTCTCQHLGVWWIVVPFFYGGVA